MRQVYALLGLVKKWGADRVEAACASALAHEQVNVGLIGRMLEILNWFDSRLTNGPTEGRNLIIKTVKRSRFGFRNFHNYRLRVLYRCS